MLSIKNLEAGYGKVKVLHGINIDVPKGQVITLIGSNGAGKTTTMRAITGMIKPTSGEVTLGGEKIDGYDSHKIARLGLAHSPEGRRVFTTMSVNDNLLLGAFPRFTGSRPKGDIKNDLERSLEMFPRLKERRNQLAGTLSGGEQQMLAMARAVMLNPEIIILDEPSMGLAPILVEQIFEIIKEINKAGTTVLLVEQNAMMALAVANRGYIVQTGEITLEDEASKLTKNPKVREAYLGV
jgi:branched-chain amino acid transport system ATP-binding protein